MKYKTFLKYVVAVCLLVVPFSLHAETHIEHDPPYETNVWTKAGSPYILDTNISIWPDRKLVLQPGVIVMSASTTDGADPYSINSAGGISILGTEAQPIHIIGLGGFSIDTASAEIRHTVMDATPLSLFNATSTISFSKLSGAGTAVYLKQSRFVISDSEISGNATGILSAASTPIFQAHIMSPVGIGGEGDSFSIDPNENRIEIHNSIIENNSRVSIKNMTVNTVDASHNWWGDASGPASTISGSVSVEPWKTADPRIKKKEPCCSNVIFLPGFEGSRLSHITEGPFGTSTARLWEPTKETDVRKLFLNSLGKSIDPTISPSGVIDSAFGISGIYAKFFVMMNGMVADKTMNEWLPFAYDWRMSQDEIATKAIAEIEHLALTSRTGKVAIVAHSNGGLVAKLIGVRLEQMGKSDLIDKAVFVAVPELGTPSAIASMLHGDGTGLLGGLIVGDGVMRTLGLNAISAYGLLPSADYFNKISTPVLTFAGKAVGSYKLFTDFLSAKTDKRGQAKESDLKSPAVLGSSHISKADWLHSIIDSWKFPSATEVLSIAGWGTPTTMTVDYSSSTPSMRKGPEGDGVVASDSTQSNLFFNLGLFNKEKRMFKSKISHADILEATPVTDILSRAIATSSLSNLLASAVPAYLSKTKPKVEDHTWMKWYTVSVHSPVDLDIYDSRGGHMGIIPLPGHPESDLKWFDNTIGGQYDIIGDEKYYTIPADDTYSVQLKGTGTGTFTYQVQKFMGEDMTEVSNTVYTDLPVTPLLVASTTLGPSVTSLPLNLDVDGNGVVDIKAGPSKTMNPIIHLDAMKTIVISLHLAPKVEKNLLQKIEKVRLLVLKDKTGKAIKKLSSIAEKLELKHWNPKKLSENDKGTLVQMFSVLLASLETL